MSISQKFSTRFVTAATLAASLFIAGCGGSSELAMDDQKGLASIEACLKENMDTGVMMLTMAQEGIKRGTPESTTFIVSKVTECYGSVGYDVDKTIKSFYGNKEIDKTSMGALMFMTKSGLVLIHQLSIDSSLGSGKILVEKGLISQESLSSILEVG
jgi:hypothetical protein